MTSLYNTTPGADLDLQDATAATAPYTGAERLGETFGHFDFSQGLGHYGGGLFHDAAADPNVDPQTLNEKYGVPGYLRFNAPKDEYDAAFEQHMALQRQQRDTVLSRSTANPLVDFASGLAGTLVDPAALATMVATGGFGEAALGAIGLKTAAEAVPAVTTLGRLANAARVPLEGALGNVPFVGINAALTVGEGGDYDAGDALRDIAAGAVLHTAAHVAFRALPGLFRRGGAAADPEALADPNAPDLARETAALQPDPAPGVPPEVDALGEDARQGAFVRAVDRLAGDEPVDVAGHIQTELETRAIEAEATRDPAAPPDQFADAGNMVGEPRVIPPETPAAEAPDEASTILADTARRFAAGDAGDLDTLRPPGRSDGGAAGGGDERADQGGAGAGAGGGPGAQARPTAEQLIAADPELKAIAEATDRFAADHGVTPAEPPEARRPATLADALHAAAVCLIGELG